jgi:hypothetical protein
MRVVPWLCLVVLLLSGCRSLSEPEPVSPPPTAVPAACQLPFLSGVWQLTHAIEATLPGRQPGLMIGVSVLSPADETFESVLLTVEGMVVFQARYEQGRVEIEGGIEPFRRDGFADGLIEDFKLVFFQPMGRLTTVSMISAEAVVCRYRLSDGDQVEVIGRGANRWEIHQYHPSGSLRRTVEAFPGDRGDVEGGALAVPGKIRLTAHGAFGYALTLRLIEAQRLSD